MHCQAKLDCNANRNFLKTSGNLTHAILTHVVLAAYANQWFEILYDFILKLACLLTEGLVFSRFDNCVVVGWSPLQQSVGFFSVSSRYCIAVCSHIRDQKWSPLTCRSWTGTLENCVGNGQNRLSCICWIIAGTREDHKHCRTICTTDWGSYH